MLSSLESRRPPVEAVKAITVPCNETILEATIQMVLHLAQFSSNVPFLTTSQRYTYKVLQTIQVKLILLCVWAERAVLGRAKTAFKIQV